MSECIHGWEDYSCDVCLLHEMERIGRERDEARAEVKKLREELCTLRGEQAGRGVTKAHHDEVVSKLHAEIDRLRGLLDENEVETHRLIRERNEARAEVERLTKEGVENAAEWAADVNHLILLEVEVERLRAASRDIATRQREACAMEVEGVVPYGNGMDADEEGMRDACADAVRDTPLVTDGPVAHEGNPSVDGRDPGCVKAWPECEDGAYNPNCCRFPKQCNCGPRVKK